MAAAARIHGIERGKDLRAYPLFAFGGAGPVHGWHVGRILRVPRVLVPFGAGAASALGLLAAPLAFDFVRTAPQRLDARGLDGREPALHRDGGGRPRGAAPGGRGRGGRSASAASAEMRYVGQGHEVEAAVPARAARAREPGAHHRRLRSRLPHALRTQPARRRHRGPELAAGGERAGPGGGDSRRGDAGRGSPGRHRGRGEQDAQGVLPGGGGLRATPVYDRYALAPGAMFAGPAIVEERESTTIIGPGSASAGRRGAHAGGGARLMLTRRDRAQVPPARRVSWPRARSPIAIPACSRCSARASTCSTWAADRAR